MYFNPIYAAYGSNLNRKQMASRCPNAQFLGMGKLKHYRLVFRGVADIEHEANAEVLVGLWKITPKCLIALDQYEGYPSLYQRNEVQVSMDKDFVDATIYKMTATGYEPPSVAYYKSIEQGYRDCGMPLSHLKMQLDRAKELYTYQMINESELLANGIK
jgi:gamma-glutamylcyclotransferase (GGCT)/AIG2-like uncharacterized protein YtfP